MPRGTGTIFQRGKTWWIRYWVAGYERRESSYSTDQDDALRLLKKRLGETASVREAGGPVTFDTLRSMLVDDYRLNGRASLPRAKLAFERLKPAFGGTRADRITTDRLTAYAQGRREAGAAAASVRMELALLRRAMRLAARAGRLDRVPVFPSIEVQNVRTGFMEADRFAAVLAHLLPWAAAAIEFLFLTGWRVSDVLGLQWRQVDLEHGSIVLERGTTKNKAGRVLPYRAHPRLAAIIDARRAVTTEVERETGRIIPWVFSRPTTKGPGASPGARVTRKALRDQWLLARAAAGAPGALVHDFRRTAARRYVRGQVPEKTAMQLLGMKTRSIFDRYNIVTEDDMAEALRKVAALPAPPAKKKRPGR